MINRTKSISLYIFIISLSLFIACSEEDNTVVDVDDSDMNPVKIYNAPPFNVDEVLQVNSQVPEYILTLASGEQINLSSPGKPVFLELWASWCSICKGIEPDIDSYLGQNLDKLIPVKLSYDYRLSDLEGYLEAKSNRTTILFNHLYDRQDNDFRNAIGKTGIPRSIVINAEGKITYIGPFNPAMIDIALDK